MSNIFKVWVDNSADPDQGRYIIENTRLEDFQPTLKRIYPNNQRAFALNPRRIQELLYLDKPDVIITHQESASDIERPVLAVEFSEQTPMGQNAYQRFPRAVAAAESSVPFAIVFPSKDWVPRKGVGTSGWDYASPFIFDGLRKLTDYHGVPCLAVDWPFGELEVPGRGFKRYDKQYANLPDSQSEEAGELFGLVNLVVENAVERRDPGALFRNKGVMAQINHLDEHRMTRGADYLRTPPPTSGKCIPTSGLGAYVHEHCDDGKFDESMLPDHIQAREECFVFRAETTSFRSDTYTGTLLVYDYSFCRYGATKDDRHTSLVFHLPKVSSDQIASKYTHFYDSRCPFKKDASADPRYLALHLRDGCRFTKQKELRVFFNFADVVVLSDLVLF